MIFEIQYELTATSLLIALFSCIIHFHTHFINCGAIDNNKQFSGIKSNQYIGIILESSCGLLYFKLLSHCINLIKKIVLKLVFIY